MSDRHYTPEQVERAVANFETRMADRTIYAGREPKDDEVLIGELKRLRERVAELEGIVERLPLTADGVRVTPDMPLWGWITRHDGTPGEVHQQNWMTAKTREIGMCYSTRAAAEAMRVWMTGSWVAHSGGSSP